jgi:hypothetical protein
VEDPVTEGVDHASEHLAPVQRASVVHRGQKPLNLKARVEPSPDLVDGLDEQRDAAEREVLALQRDDHSISAA